eukprot:gene7340-15909_t
MVCAGASFGEVALLRRQPRNATVAAASEPCAVLRLDAEIFLRYLGPPDLPPASAAREQLGPAHRSIHSMELGCFLSIVHELKRRHVSLARDRGQDMVDAFAALGGRRGRKGHVPLATLIDVARAFRLTIDVRQLVKDMDRDSDGRVDFGEFAAVLATDGAHAGDLFSRLGGGADPQTGAPAGTVEIAAVREAAELIAAGAGCDPDLCHDVIRLAELSRGPRIGFADFVDAVLTPAASVARDPAHPRGLRGAAGASQSIRAGKSARDLMPLLSMLQHAHARRPAQDGGESDALACGMQRILDAHAAARARNRRDHRRKAARALPPPSPSPD